MTRKIIMAGFGGQGIMAMGQLITYSGMLEGKNVSWMPSYGPEMRGGSANCSVVVSKEPVGAPVISKATDLVVMNQPSFDKFQEMLIPGGNLFVNSSLIHLDNVREDINIFSINANETAVLVGNAKAANMVMLGALLEVTNVVEEESVIKAFTKVYGDAKKKLIPLNQEAIKKGREAIAGGGEKVHFTHTKIEEESKTPKSNIPTGKPSYVSNMKKDYNIDGKIFNSALDTVKEAILNETEGINFYKMAAQQFSGSSAEKIFESLAHQEEEHIYYLKKLEEQLINRDEELGVAGSLKLESENQEEKLEWGQLDASKATMALSIFSVGMTLENQARDFYEKAMEKSEFEGAKALYKELIYWENFHYEQLKSQYEIYKDKWWSDQSYSPF